MNKNILIIIGVIVLVLAGGGLFLASQQKNGSEDAMMEKNENSVMKEESSDDETMMKEGYSGQILAGNSSPFLVFNQVDYDKAVSDGKIVFLDFYANWCPICRAEAPELHAGFNELNRDDIIGFRVNFNDTETSEDEKALADEFDITYQHTKVILQNGKEVLKDGDHWDRAKFLEEINKL